MYRDRPILLAALIGAVALGIGGGLLLIGRLGDRDTFTPQMIDAPALLNLTETLSSDALEGRATGTRGAEAARGFIRKRFETLGLRKIGGGYEHVFPILPPPNAADGFPTEGVNLVGWIAGKTPGQGPVIVITAHYDHVGVVDGEVHNGADDNASGTAGLIALAEHFTRTPPDHDLVFVAFDAEEIGLLGARHFVRSGLLPVERMSLNINLDMVSRSDVGELHVAGPYHTPPLRAMMETLALTAPVTLRIGHDSPDLGDDDWTLLSDHAAFHEVGVPFLYFGVEDHADYHQPTDDFSKIMPDFFVRSVEAIAMAAEAADESVR